MLAFLGRGLVGCAAGALAIAAAGAAEASTIYTYRFEQTGYSYPTLGIGPVSKVTGSFTGTTDATDHITLSTLTAFQVKFDVDGFGGGGVFYGDYSGLPTYFSFQVGNGDTFGTTLAFDAPLNQLIFPASSSEICVGAAVPFFCDGGTSTGAVRVALGGTPTVFAHTDSGPTLTLVSAVSSTPDTPPPVTATPIPGALLLFGTALGGLGALSRARRKATCAAV